MASFTQAQLDALERAIATGARSVQYEDRLVTYRNLDEMLRARALIQKSLGLVAAPTPIMTEYDRGLCSSTTGLEGEE